MNQDKTFEVGQYFDDGTKVTDEKGQCLARRVFCSSVGDSVFKSFMLYDYFSLNLVKSSMEHRI